MGNVAKSLQLALSLVVCNLGYAEAQGVFETSKVMQLDLGKGMTGQNIPAFGSQVNTTSKSNEGKTRQSSISREQMQVYTAELDKLYLEAQKKEKAGALSEAYKLYEKSVVLRTNIWGDRDPAIFEIVRLQMQIALKENRLENAEVCCRKMLAIVGRKYGPGSPQSIPIVARLAEIYEKQNKHSASLGFYKQLLALLERYSPIAGEVEKTRTKLQNIQAKLEGVDATVPGSVLQRPVDSNSGSSASQAISSPQTDSSSSQTFAPGAESSIINNTIPNKVQQSPLK